MPDTRRYQVIPTMPAWSPTSTVSCTSYLRIARYVKVRWMNGLDALEHLLAMLHNQRNRAVIWGHGSGSRIGLIQRPGIYTIFNEHACAWDDAFGRTTRKLILPSWRLGDDALIQVNSFTSHTNEFDSFVESKSGISARDQLFRMASDPEARPLVRNGELSGFIFSDQSYVDFYDCDEESWTNYVSNA